MTRESIEIALDELKGEYALAIENIINEYGGNSYHDSYGEADSARCEAAAMFFEDIYMQMSALANRFKEVEFEAEESDEHRAIEEKIWNLSQSSVECRGGTFDHFDICDEHIFFTQFDEDGEERKWYAVYFNCSCEDEEVPTEYSYKTEAKSGTGQIKNLPKEVQAHIMEIISAYRERDRIERAEEEARK